MDFLARGPEGDAHLIQVCAEVDEAETLSREVRALKAAGAVYPRAPQQLVTLTPRVLTAELPTSIKVRTAAAWLLGG